MTPPGNTYQSRPIGHSVLTVNVMTPTGALWITGAIIENLEPPVDAVVIDVTDNVGGDGGLAMPTNVHGLTAPDGSPAAAEKPIRLTNIMQIPLDGSGNAIVPFNGCYFDYALDRNRRLIIEGFQITLKAADYWKISLKLRNDPSI